MGDDQDVEKGCCNNSHTTSSDTQTRLSRKGYHTLGDSADGYDGLDEEGDRSLGTRTSRVRAAGVEMEYVQVNAATKEEDGEESSSQNEMADEDKITRHLAFFGCLSIVHVVLQFWGSFAFGSLALLSDAFHNLFDVGAIGLASYTHRLQRKQDFIGKDGNGDTLPFGYKRAEVIGGLINSITLLSLSAYVVLTAIPRLFVPTEVDSGWAYIGLAFAGVLVNLVGVVCFAAAGDDCHGNGHDGGFLFAHSHNHGHGHGHDVKGGIDSNGVDSSTSPCSSGADHDEHSYYRALKGEKVNNQRSESKSAVTDAAVRTGEIELTPGETTVEGDDDDMLSGGANQNEFCLGKRSGEESCEGFGREEEAWVPDGRCIQADEKALSCEGVRDGRSFDSVRGASGPNYRRKRNTSDDGRSDSHVRSGVVACNGNGHDSGVSGVADMAGKDHHDHHGHHGHHGHLHLEDDSSHQVHAHGHAQSHCHELADMEHVHGHGHGHGHGKKSGTCGGGQSMNILAVFLHALVDVVSSALVCLQSAMIYFLGSRDRVEWTDYLDPLTSIGLSFFIAWTALPLVKECVHVLLEGTPRDTDPSHIKAKLLSIPGVFSVLHLNIIQLNGRDPHVAIVSLVISNMESSCDHGEGRDQRRLLPAVERGIDRDRILCDAKDVLSRFNVGRSSIEIVSRAYVNDETQFGDGHEVARPCTRAGTGAETGTLQDGRGREANVRDRDGHCGDNLRGSSSSQAHHGCNGHDPIVHHDDFVSGGEPLALEGVEHISHDSSAVLV